MLDDYEQKLLQGWEEVYKKSQLTFWILLALKDSPKHMAEIKDYILLKTNGTLEADDKSMYRALRRYTDVDMLSFNLEQNDSGPDRKIYKLTDTGLNVLSSFSRRNILDIYYKTEIVNLLEK